LLTNLSLLLAGAVLGTVWGLKLPAGRDRELMRSASAGPTPERLRELSTLATLKVDVADAMVTQLRGRTGGVTAVRVILGEVVIGVDLSAANIDTAGNQARRTVVSLPEPTVQFVRLDQERTKLLRVWSDGLWQITPGGTTADTAAVNTAYRDAQRVIADAAEDPALVDRARAQAERVLRSFFAALGSDVDIRWPARPAGTVRGDLAARCQRPWGGL
jgi:hypothetical protein